MHSSSEHLGKVGKHSFVYLLAWRVALHTKTLAREVLSHYYKVTQETRDRWKTENGAAEGLNHPLFFFFSPGVRQDGLPQTLYRQE